MNLEYTTDNIVLFVFDPITNENKFELLVMDFINWLNTIGEPYANRGVKKYFELTPSWKIIDNAIKFDQLKIKRHDQN